MRIGRVLLSASAAVLLVAGCNSVPPPPTLETAENYLLKLLRDCPIATLSDLTLINQPVTYKDYQKRYHASITVGYTLTIQPLPNLAEIKQYIEDKRVAYKEIQSKVDKLNSSTYIRLRNNIERNYNEQIRQLDPDYFNAKHRLAFSTATPPLPEDKLAKYQALTEEMHNELQKYSPPISEALKANREWEAARNSLNREFMSQCRLPNSLLQPDDKLKTDIFPDYTKLTNGGSVTMKSVSLDIPAEKGEWPR